MSESTTTQIAQYIQSLLLKPELLAALQRSKVAVNLGSGNFDESKGTADGLQAAKGDGTTIPVVSIDAFSLEKGSIDTRKRSSQHYIKQDMCELPKLNKKIKQLVREPAFPVLVLMRHPEFVLEHLADTSFMLTFGMPYLLRHGGLAWLSFHTQEELNQAKFFLSIVDKILSSRSVELKHYEKSASSKICHPIQARIQGPEGICEVPRDQYMVTMRMPKKLSHEQLLQLSIAWRSSILKKKGELANANERAVIKFFEQRITQGKNTLEELEPNIISEKQLFLLINKGVDQRIEQLSTAATQLMTKRRRESSIWCDSSKLFPVGRLGIPPQVSIQVRPEMVKSYVLKNTIYENNSQILLTESAEQKKHPTGSIPIFSVDPNWWPRTEGPENYSRLKPS